MTITHTEHTDASEYDRRSLRDLAQGDTFVLENRLGPFLVINNDPNDPARFRWLTDAARATPRIGPEGPQGVYLVDVTVAVTSPLPFKLDTNNR